MSIPPEIAQMIHHCLGASTTRSMIEVAGETYDLFAAPAPSTADWILPDTHRLHEQDVRLYFARGGSRLKAIWRLLPLQIVEYERVGTHNGEVDDWRRFQALVLHLTRDIPFDVFFADEAGLDLRFSAPVPPDRAREIDRVLLDQLAAGDLWLVDSYTFMLETAAGLRLSPDRDADERGGGLVASLIASGRLRFWWD